MQGVILCDNGNLEGVLSPAKERGLGVELQAFYRPEVLESPAQTVAAYRPLLTGLRGPVSLHGPFADLFPGSFDPLVRQVARVRMEQALSVAADLGLRHIVLHHGFVPNTSNPERWVTRSRDFWRDLLSRAPADVQIHLENLLEWEPGILLAVLRAVADDRLGVCLDVGHAHALSRMPVVSWVEALGEAVTYVHLHDNLGERDEHLPLGQGNLPLGETLAALERHAPGALWAVEADVGPSLAWLQGQGHVA